MTGKIPAAAGENAKKGVWYGMERMDRITWPDTGEMPTVWEIARKIGAAGGRALLVGGCVRDRLLGAEPHDFDLEIFGLAPEAVRRALEPAFALENVGAAFGVFKVRHHEIDLALPRRENKVGRGHRGFLAAAEPELSFAEAAARRDLTVNAISCDPLTGEVVDPWNGRADLAAGVLRHVGPAFVEDPLRVLRTMQFAARLGFRVDPATVVLCAAMEPEGLPRERLAGEWEKLLLQGRAPSLGLDFLRACGWVRYYPELAALIGCEQTPAWHPEGDVWNHTLIACDRAAERRTGNRDDDLTVICAVLCHDFGKPAVSERRPDGRISCFNHEAAGAGPTRAFLRRLWNREAWIESVVRLVREHMRPYDFGRDGASDRAYRKLAVRVGRLDLLAAVAEADALARPPLPTDMSCYQRFRERARALAVEQAPPEPLILGRHLIDRGLSPGPGFAPLLEKCYEAQLEGRFADLAGGLVYLDSVIAEFRQNDLQKKHSDLH